MITPEEYDKVQILLGKGGGHVQSATYSRSSGP